MFFGVSVLELERSAIDLQSLSKKKTASEMKASRVNDLKVKLRTKHGSFYSSVQYASRWRPRQHG